MIKLALIIKKMHLEKLDFTVMFLQILLSFQLYTPCHMCLNIKLFISFFFIFILFFLFSFIKKNKIKCFVCVKIVQLYIIENINNE